MRARRRGRWRQGGGVPSRSSAPLFDSVSVAQFAPPPGVPGAYPFAANPNPYPYPSAAYPGSGVGAAGGPAGTAGAWPNPGGVGSFPSAPGYPVPGYQGPSYPPAEGVSAVPPPMAAMGEAAAAADTEEFEVEKIPEGALAGVRQTDSPDSVGRTAFLSAVSFALFMVVIWLVSSDDRIGYLGAPLSFALMAYIFMLISVRGGPEGAE